MGSTGSGSFSDYSQRGSTSPQEKNGGASGEDKCGKAFESVLEDVSRCFYFINYGHVPPIGTDVIIVFNGIRLAVETMKGEEIGYLPTSRNYVKVCMDSGFSYRGTVSTATNNPVPGVGIDVTPV